MKKSYYLIFISLFASVLLLSSCTKQFTIVVNANDDTMGVVTGSGTYHENEEITISAAPNNGYTFVQWSDGNTENPRTVTVSGDASYMAIFQAEDIKGAIVSFRGKTWVAQQIDAYDHSDEGYLTFTIFKTANDDNDIFLSGCLQTAPGTYTYESSDDGYDGDYFYYTDPNNMWVDELGQVPNSEPGNVYGNWMADITSYMEHITSVDLSEKVINATFSENLFMLSEYFSGIDTKYPLTCTMTNASWQWKSVSKNSDKKSRKNLYPRIK